MVILESHRPATEHYLTELAAAGGGARRGEAGGDAVGLTMENEAL